MYRTLIGLLLLLATRSAHALMEARLLAQSSSGRTVVFNLGTHDGMKEGDYGVVVKQIKSQKQQDLRYVPAAKVRNIKTTTDSSIWILYHFYDAELLVKGEKFVLMTETNMMGGQRQPKIGRATVVAPPKKVSEVAKAAVSDDKDRLGKLDKNYTALARVHGQKYKSENDFDLIDLEQWEKAKGQRYRSSLYRSSHKDEFKSAYRLDVFHDLVAAYLERVNDPNFSYEKFYEEQMRDEFSNEFRKKRSIHNEYDDFLFAESKKATEDARIYRSILEKGGSWSEDFSDEELRKVLKRVSISQEEDRRESVVSRPLRFALLLEYGFILNDTQTDRDHNYRRDRLSELGIDLEMTPFLKHETLERFTFNVAGKNTKSAFDADGTNVNFDLVSLSFGANWYPFYSPYVIKAPLLFVGAYIRSGYATAESPATGDGAKYGAIAFPGFRGGMRYNVRNNVGLRIVASMETLKLERYEVNRLGAGLPEEQTVIEAKMAVGLSYSF